MGDEVILYPDTPFDLEPSLVLLARRGSESHGTYVPSTDPGSIDDRDLMGVCIPPKAFVLGLRSWEHAESIKNEWDVVLYEFRKFVRLLCKQNPNVIGMLWLEQEDYLKVGPAGRLLIENRSLFRARDAAFETFAGYANSQLQKMTRCACQGYMGEKRKKLVEKFGYDTKNAAHLVRLLHMGREYLLTGKLKVRRVWDRDMLIDIKRGERRLEDIQSYAGDCFEELKEASIRSVLPEAIDEAAVDALVVRCMEEALNG